MKPESSLRNCTAAKRAIDGIVNLMSDWRRAYFLSEPPMCDDELQYAPLHDSGEVNRYEQLKQTRSRQLLRL